MAAYTLILLVSVASFMGLVRLLTTDPLSGINTKFTSACPNPVRLEYGLACACTGTSCGAIPSPDAHRLKTGHAFVVTSQKDVGFLNATYVPLEERTSDDAAQMQMSVNFHETYQEILGFGGAFTDAAAYNYNTLDEAAQEQFLQQYFGKVGIGYTMGRVNIGGCDFSRMDYSLNNITGDLDMQNFCLRDDRASDAPCGKDHKADFIHAAKRAMMGGTLKLFGSIWSAPTWLKDQNFECTVTKGMNDCKLGASRPAVDCRHTVGNPATCLTNAQAEPCPATPPAPAAEPFNPQKPTPTSPQKNANDNCYRSGFLSSDDSRQAAYALYLSKFVDAYEAFGIKVWGLTIQNEPLAFTYLWQSMSYTPELQARFLAKHLGPLFRKKHPDLKLMIHDDQTIALMTAAKAILDDPEAAKYIDGVAYHWYMALQGTYEDEEVIAPFWPLSKNEFGGGKDVARIWKQLNENQFLLASEACNGYTLSTDWVGPRPGEWGYGYSYSHDILWQLRNMASGWIDWNLILNQQGGPNVAGNYVDAPIHVHNSSTFYQNPSFFHIAHFSKYVVPGSKQVKLDITCGARRSEYCQAVAFLTPKRQVVVVLTNDEITVGPLAGIGIARVILSPWSARGQGSDVLWGKSLTWSIKCGQKTLHGEIPWQAIQTVVLDCDEGFSA
eukprot:TRINITY_DN47637_c0_g1_i1.p1 TRINITY_DN47637_c0_g1~~TRINITY_DN47637_c0_g1_i1.p1  ORF type:complete len:715 (-),score=53.45 TRINITY_DN47637_c0_g1_i1:146-2146(-)